LHVFPVFQAVDQEVNAMKKWSFVLAALLLMGTYGCSSDEAKKGAEETGGTAPATREAVVEAMDKAMEKTDQAVTATKEAASGAMEKTAEMTEEAVSATKETASGAMEKAGEMTK
jgi:predicted  nucleic acid-binding Zn-ribbon protein